ncbi:MAG: proline dehydrogenase family protein [Acidobacteriia bacterium]|nr:proline dehydrogenase family protein [Terriglobia bacterium]
MRAILLFLSHRESFKNFMLRFKIFRKTAWRFVAGETIDDAIRAAREANLQGIRATLDLLGENTLSQEDALRSTGEIIGLLDRIYTEKVDCNVSVKLTQLGLDLGTDFCRQNLIGILRRAAELGNFVRVDMEDSNYTQRTLDIVLQAHRETANVGTVIQAYLYRSEDDVRRLIENGVEIRLCKGAYLEPATVAFRKKRDTDANYVRLMKLLLASGLRHGIATHDEAMIDATRQFAREKNIPKDHFELQMLFGIRRDLQQQLALQGYNMRVYIPYGVRWYPYYMRRLAERPANLLFIARNLLRQ